MYLQLTVQTERTDEGWKATAQRTDKVVRPEYRTERQPTENGAAVAAISALIHDVPLNQR